MIELATVETDNAHRGDVYHRIATRHLIQRVPDIIPKSRYNLKRVVADTRQYQEIELIFTTFESVVTYRASGNHKLLYVTHSTIAYQQKHPTINERAELNPIRWVMWASKFTDFIMVPKDIIPHEDTPAPILADWLQDYAESMSGNIRYDELIHCAKLYRTALDFHTEQLK